MKVACYVHPIVHALGPDFNYGHFTFLAGLLRTLHRSGDVECLMIAGSRFFARAALGRDGAVLEGLRVAALDEVVLQRKIGRLGVRPASLDSLAHQHQTEHAALRLLADEIAAACSDFEPDVVISFAVQVEFLKAIWPHAFLLHGEMGPYARNPYPPSFFFDHLGIYGQSALARHGRQLRHFPASAEARTLAAAFRRRNERALAEINPFAPRRHRDRFARCCLLPLQVSNYYSFDDQTGYRNQFEFLFDFLSNAPRDVGIIVTEYVEWGPVLLSCGPSANNSFLRHAFPNLVFDQEFRAWHAPSQFLVPEVDGVWSVSSNVGLQALLFKKLLGSPGTSHLANIAHATTPADFFDELQRGPSSRDNDAFVAWQLERYLVPQTLLSDGRWLRDYLERRAAAARGANDPMDAFVPIAPIDVLEQAWIRKAPAPVALARNPLAGADAVVQEQLDAILQSTCWTMTAPLRRIADTVRRRRPRLFGARKRA
jgi:hypothetical protein